jgi:hypothetical protein
MDTDIGATAALPRAGTALENPLVYDASAQDIRVLAEQGRVKIVREVRGTLEGGTAITTELVFTKLK